MVYYYNCQIKMRQNFLLAYICMAIPYRTAKVNILAIAILGSTAKFNSCQYFRLYSMSLEGWYSVKIVKYTYIGMNYTRPELFLFAAEM